MHVQRRAVRWRFIDSGGGGRRRPRHRLHGAAFGDGEPASGSRSLRRRKVWRQAAPVTCDTDDFESGRFVVNGHLGKRGGDAAADRPPERRGVGPGRPAKEPAWTHLPPDGRARVCLATVASETFLPGMPVMVASFPKEPPGFDGDVAVIHDGLSDEAHTSCRPRPPFGRGRGWPRRHPDDG